MSFKTIFIMLAGLLFLYGLFTVGFPFLLALVFALALEPVVKLTMKLTRMNRAVSVTAVCTLFTLVLLGLVYLIGLKIFSEVAIFLKKLPDLVAQADKIIQDTLSRTQGLYDEIPDDLLIQLQKGADAGMSALIDALSGLSKSMLNIAAVIPSLFIIFIVFLVALYLTSFSLNTIKDSFLSVFEESSRDQISEVLANLHKSIFGFIRAQIVISGLTYLVALLGLLILKVDYALAIALLIIIVDILPILGTGSVLVPWATVSIFTGNTFLGIGLIVLFLVITVFRRTIEPKIIGDSIGIGALSTLISLWVGFELVGVVGIFLGPIVVIIYQAMRKVGLLDFKIRLE